MVTTEMMLFALLTCGALTASISFVYILWPLLMSARQRRMVGAAFDQRVRVQEERIARREHWTHPPLRRRLDFDLYPAYETYDDPYGYDGYNSYDIEGAS